MFTRALFCADRAVRRTRSLLTAAIALVLLASGSSAFAQTTTVTAAWDRNTDALTTGYMVYYGTSAGSYQWSYDAGNQVSAQLTLNQGATYYFSVRAYNSSAQVGPASNEASFTAPGGAAPTAQITATLQGTNAVVTWSTTNATSARINGTAVALSGTQTVPVTATTTFTIVATNAAGATATRSATVTVSAPAAPTATITASLQGTNAVVTWSTTNATSARINGATVALSGTQTVPVTATTTFTIVATNAAGATATRSATVTVSAPAAPTAAISASLQGTNAVVTWSTTNATSARINGATVALSGTQTVPVSATTTFTIVATNAAGATATRSATVTVSTAPTTPSAPTAQITATLQGGNALLTWATTNAIKAEINGTVVGLSGSISVPVSATTTFRLLATAANGAMAERSATVTVTAPVTGAPSAPTGLATTVVGTRVTFSWAAPASGPRPTHYLIDVGPAGTTKMLVSGYSVGNVLSISADLPKGDYVTRLRAANTYGVSGYSSLVTFKVGRRLQSPRSFSVQWSGTTAIMTWSAPAADGPAEDVPTSYVLEAGTSPGASNVATVNLGNVTRFSVPIPSGTYYVRLRAENSLGSSDPTADVALVAPGAPAAPTTLVASRSTTTLAFRWNAPSGPAPTGYLLEAGSAPGLSDLAVLRLPSVTTFSLAAPPPGTYYVRVRAVNAAGAGQASNEFVVR